MWPRQCSTLFVYTYIYCSDKGVNIFVDVKPCPVPTCMVYLNEQYDRIIIPVWYHLIIGVVNVVVINLYVPISDCVRDCTTHSPVANGTHGIQPRCHANIQSVIGPFFQH